MYERGIFIFRRDLRINDNIGLWEATRRCKTLFPIFIFTPEQVSSENQYRSQNAIQFMIESLDDLDKSLLGEGSRLMTLYGDNVQVLTSMIRTMKIDCIFFNRDYTPYSLKRDRGIHELCEKMSVACETFSDYYLFEPGKFGKNGLNDPDIYKKFTPFYTKALKNLKHIQASKMGIKKGILSYEKNNDKQILLKDAYVRFAAGNPLVEYSGGRTNGLNVLVAALRNQGGYSKTRDQLAVETSRLSAYIKFGCVSIREVYHRFVSAFGQSSPLVRQLFWREFYAQILFANPTLLGRSLNQRYDNIKWENDRVKFNAWKEGRTGFPVVDACMRQLNATGYMHNRGRLIVASFLIKTLLIDWRWGEKYFATRLVDYDVASNSQNWLWVSGGGADSQPYFRIFSPWEQAKKCDPDAEYIKKWIPELKDVEAKVIHAWNIKGQYGVYNKPIVDYAEEKTKALAMYSKIFD